MGACAGCGQLVLVLINLLFSLVGLALLVISCLIKTGAGVFDSLLSEGYNKFVQAVKEAAEVQNFDIDHLDIGKIVGDSAIAFIVIGAFFFLLGIFGCLGAVCKTKVLLTIYAVILAVVFVAEVVCVVLLFTIKSTIDGWIKKPLIDTLKEDYTGTNGSDVFSTTINFVMHQMECCGIENYTEFAEATKWGYEPDVRVIPNICCMNVSDIDCTSNPSSNNSYIDQGCFMAVNDWLTERKNILLGVGGGVALVQLLLIIFSIVICCQARRDDDDDDKESYDEQFPIQPYREPPELHGHKNMSYDDGPYSGREGYPEYRNPQNIGVQYYRGDSRTNSQIGYTDAQYYQGRTDRYTGPPHDYRR